MLPWREGWALCWGLECACRRFVLPEGGDKGDAVGKEGWGIGTRDGGAAVRVEGSVERSLAIKVEGSDVLVLLLLLFNCETVVTGGGSAAALADDMS